MTSILFKEIQMSEQQAAGAALSMAMAPKTDDGEQR